LSVGIYVLIFFYMLVFHYY